LRLRGVTDEAQLTKSLKAPLRAPDPHCRYARF
jgi:hypothetical protein